METILKIILGVLVGTSLMTLCSYFFSHLLNKQFREPVLLHQLLERSLMLDKPKIPAWIGWLLHYSVGISFVILYHFFWHSTAVDPNATSGLLLGLASGLLGVSGWLFFFWIHSEPPSIDFKTFYLQLIVVHLIFGLGATFGYLLV